MRSAEIALSKRVLCYYWNQSLSSQKFVSLTPWSRLLLAACASSQIVWAPICVKRLECFSPVGWTASFKFHKVNVVLIFNQSDVADWVIRHITDLFWWIYLADCWLPHYPRFIVLNVGCLSWLSLVLTHLNMSDRCVSLALKPSNPRLHHHSDSINDFLQSWIRVKPLGEGNLSWRVFCAHREQTRLLPSQPAALKIYHETNH